MPLWDHESAFYHAHHPRLPTSANLPASGHLNSEMQHNPDTRGDAPKDQLWNMPLWDHESAFYQAHHPRLPTSANLPASGHLNSEMQHNPDTRGDPPKDQLWNMPLWDHESASTGSLQNSPPYPQLVDTMGSGGTLHPSPLYPKHDQAALFHSSTTSFPFNEGGNQEAS
ncbi:hypothetical protein ACQY0O_004991 [Thecaphora frezii]